MSGSLTTDKITWIERTFGLKLPMGPPPGDRPAAPGGKAPTGASDPSSSDVRAAMMTTAQDLLKDLGETVEFDDHPDAGVPTDAGPAKPGPDAAKLDADAKKIVAAMQDWKDRQAKITITYEMSSVLKPFQKAIENFAAALKTSVKKNDATDALNAMPAVETALKALEAEAARRAKDLPKKQKAATDAADKIDKMSDADIGKMKAEDKAALLREMLGAGKPTGKVRDAQKKLYADTDIDPDFRKDDEARQDKVAADLKNDKELATARGGWDTLDMEGLRKNLGKVVAAQSKEYGIAPPPIIFFPDEEEGISKAAGKVLGYFKESDGKLHINLDPTAGIKDFTQSINVVLHENAHHYQAELAKMVEAKTLKPTDPRYKQALMFAVNELTPGGYIDPDESADKAKGFNDYKNQPLERSSFETGTKTAAKVSNAVKPPARGS